MIEDPIIAEIHNDRKEHAAYYANDLKCIVAALRIEEHKSQRNLLNPGPKMISIPHTNVLNESPYRLN